MQLAVVDFLKNCFRSVFTILGLTVGLTCIMLILLLGQPEPTRYQCNCTGYAKSKRSGNPPLLTVPVLLYPVHAAGAQADTGSSIE